MFEAQIIGEGTPHSIVISWAIATETIKLWQYQKDLRGFFVKESYMIFPTNFEEKKFARRILGNPVINKIVCDINKLVPLSILVIMEVKLI